MAWPTTAVATGDLITAAQLNLLPIQLAESTVSGSVAASIDLTSIPTIYSTLQLVFDARSDDAGTLTSLRVRFNADTGNTYVYEELTASAATATASEVLGTSSALVGRIPAAGAASAAYSGGGVIWIPNYAASTFRKRWVSLWGGNYDALTGTVRAGFAGGYWNDSSAITRITLLALAGNLAVGSHVTLWGYP